MFLLQDSCGSQRAPQAGDMGGEEGRRKLVDSSRSELGTWTAWADPATGEEEEEREVGTTSGDCKELPSSAKLPSPLVTRMGGGLSRIQFQQQAVEGDTGAATVTSMMLLFTLLANNLTVCRHSLRFSLRRG